MTLLLIAVISAIGGTITFSRFYKEYENKINSVKVADAVMKLGVDSIYRVDSQKNRVSQSFNKTANEITIYDVEPEDEIEYYFTISGADKNRVNEVAMNATLSITVRLETKIGRASCHLKFKLPKQNSDKDNYAGAKVFVDVQVVAEQVQNV